MNRIVAHATAGIVLSLAFLPACSASTATCAPSPRMISPFGAVGTPAPDISVPANIRSQLHQFVAARQVLNTHLSHAGEQVIVYDTASDDSDPRPRLAFITGDKVASVLDGEEISNAPGGFTRFQSACEFEAAPHHHAIAFAFTSAGDGAASNFAIVMRRSGHYRPVFNLQGAQSQLLLSQNSITFWNSEGTGNCIWCPSKYETVRYSWQNGTYIKTSTKKRQMRFDPGFVSGTPLRK